ncbi:MAG: patatin-like phospholipase family protein [Gammaproteobacteria bacterium]
MSALSVYAGPVALARIREEGIQARQFEFMLGASGGPKWFVLRGLDRYLFGEFLRDREQPLYTLGSSAGAWRMSCLASLDPVASIERLADLYSHEQYSARPDMEEITRSAKTMLRQVFSNGDVLAIANNKSFKTHIIADRALGLAATGNELLQGMHLALTAAANCVSRRSLSWFFRRCVFSTDPLTSPWHGLPDLATEYYPLTAANLAQVMLATGSIPFALAAVHHIQGAVNGVYWDGGITDYHLDLPCRGEGLVLYPHFSADLIPGWFDKKLPWRQVNKANYDNVVLLCPSAEFVAGLPYGKISERSDFRTMAYPERVGYWQKVLDQSQLLADEFFSMVENGTGLDSIRPLSERPGR